MKQYQSEVSVRLTNKLNNELRKESLHVNVPKAKLIRNAINKYLVK